MAYDGNNVFARILRGEIPNDTVYEDEHTLAFRDINPQAPVHVLVIPKGPYEDMAAFAAGASAEEQAALCRAIGKVVEATGVGGAGYRLIANNGPAGVQEVPHLHFHILGGRPLGRMLSRPRE